MFTRLEFICDKYSSLEPIGDYLVTRQMEEDGNCIIKQQQYEWLMSSAVDVWIFQNVLVIVKLVVGQAVFLVCFLRHVT